MDCLKSISAALILFFSSCERLPAQIADNFSDANFTENPAWSGTTESFLINAAGQLQLNASAAGTSWLSTHFEVLPTALIEWEILVKQSFSPSGANFGRIYLMSDQTDLGAELNGYFLQLGEAGSGDAVELFRQSGQATSSVCRGTTASVASAFEIRIKVVRSPEGKWEIYTDLFGGRNFVQECTGSDQTHISSLAFGVMCTYTITNATRFYYDDISIHQLPVADRTAPAIASVEVISSSSLSVKFSEQLLRDSAEVAGNYRVTPQGGVAAKVTLQADQRTVVLDFPEPFANGYPSNFSVTNASDTAGNTMPLLERAFLYFQPFPVSFGDIIFTEVLPDPSPPAGLPEAEFVELLNRSANPIQLEGWHLSDGTTTATLSAFILLPGDYIVLCPPAFAADFERYGYTLDVNPFPSLNNAGDYLRLSDAEGYIIDSLRYTSTWYGEEDKEEGGWSLERIDPENFCDTRANWTASTAPAGGTPGSRNTVYRILPDTSPPQLLEAIRMSENAVQLVFDERLEFRVPLPADFAIDPAVEITTVTFGDPGLTTLMLTVSPPLDTILTYKVRAMNLTDCHGNRIDPDLNTAWIKGDTLAPMVVSVTAESATSVRVTFSEQILASTAGALSQYYVENCGHPVSATMDQDETTVLLSFSTPFTNGELHDLTISGVSDAAGNIIKASSFSFLYFERHPVKFQDVVFSELLPDPAPPAGLPEVEFVEIYNRSLNPVNLSGWTLGDETSIARLGSVILRPDHYLVITASVNAGKFPREQYPAVAGVANFPSLNNAGDALILKDDNGVTIDSIAYNLSWYHDNEKSDGGWSMELIDPENLCAGEANWSSSEAMGGGTPGYENSVRARILDSTPPRLLSTIPIDAHNLLVTFDEKLEAPVPSPDRFTIVPSIGVAHSYFADGTLSRLVLVLGDSLNPGILYSLSVADVRDCPGNTIVEAFSSATFLLPEKAEPGDIIINEVLFNPRPTGVDFIEVFNRSRKTVDLKGWSVRNPLSTTRRQSAVLTDEPLLLPPENYRVFSADVNTLQGEYIMGAAANFVEVEIPSLDDDMGAVVLTGAEGDVIDSIEYHEDWHSPFIRDADGVSLERIAADQTGLGSSNWRSASAASGFATPGYVNSNHREHADIGDGSVAIEPEVIRPGIAPQDFARISYSFSRGGFVANVKVLDAEGRTIKSVTENELLGIRGAFRWDGDGDNGLPARTGYYLVWFEIFDDQGMVRTFRKRVAVF